MLRHTTLPIIGLMWLAAVSGCTNTRVHPKRRPPDLGSEVLLALLQDARACPRDVAASPYSGYEPAGQETLTLTKPRGDQAPAAQSAAEPAAEAQTRQRASFAVTTPSQDQDDLGTDFYTFASRPHGVSPSHPQDVPADVTMGASSNTQDDGLATALPTPVRPPSPLPSARTESAEASRRAATPAASAESAAGDETGSGAQGPEEAGAQQKASDAPGVTAVLSQALAVLYGAGPGFTGVSAGPTSFTGIGAGAGFTGIGAGPGFTGIGAGPGFTGIGAGPGFTGIGADRPLTSSFYPL